MKETNLIAMRQISAGIPPLGRVGNPGSAGLLPGLVGIVGAGREPGAPGGVHIRRVLRVRSWCIIACVTAWVLGRRAAKVASSAFSLIGLFERLSNISLRKANGVRW